MNILVRIITYGGAAVVGGAFVGSSEAMKEVKKAVPYVGGALALFLVVKAMKK